MLLSGCAQLQDNAVLKRSAQWLDLGNRGGSERDEAYDAEVQQLFAQPYIDPLTRYLEHHRSDETRAAHLQQVLEERNLRCEQIAERYATKPLTEQTLEQYRAGYDYSCPQQVAAFGQRLQQASREDKVVQTTTAVKPADEIDLSRPLAQQLNDCYLLTTIGNFSDARTACAAPAEKGDPRARYNMALVARSLEEYEDALNWAHLAAPHSVEARYLLGQLYEAGQGVAADDNNALSWYLDAAEQGYAPAQYLVGLFLAEGRGAKQNPRAAVEWYERAAAQGLAQAQVALGEMLLRGEGVEANPAQGHMWMLRAARQGLAEAQLLLGELAEKAGGGPVSRAEAAVWYELAGQNGLEAGSIRARNLRIELAPETLQEARLKVRRVLEGAR